MTKRLSYLERAENLAKQDPELGQQMPKPEVFKALCTAQSSLAEILFTAFTAYGDRPALGQRAYLIESDADTGLKTKKYQSEYRSVTYAELLNGTLACASAWQKDGPHKVEPDDFVCIMGFSGIEFVTIDLACVFAQAVTVPIQAAYGFETLSGIVKNIEPRTIATTVLDLDMAIKLSSVSGATRSLIVFDYDERDEADRAALAKAEMALRASRSKVSLVTLQDLKHKGDPENWTFLPDHKEGPDRLAAIIHSSGSTGTPKGAMLQERALTDHFRYSKRPAPVISMGLAPLNHLTGRVGLCSALGQGGVVHFTLEPDMSTLFEDIRLVRPTVIGFFPRILDLIYQDYLNEISKLKRTENLPEEEAAKRIMADMSANYLGDRMLSGSVSGAPTTKAVRAFVKECFGINFGDAYGNTEAGSGVLLINNRVQRPNVIEYKLRDVPELGYYTTDKPYPRGELCYKTRNQILGYYKHPEATAQLFDEEGFSLTGDIVEERGEDYLVLVDRRKDVLKLSQGEYVALGRLGTIFESGSDIIQQMYMYGNSLKSYVLAIIVADQDALTQALGAAPEDKAVNRLIRAELKKVADAASLKSFEIPRRFIIETEPFTQENGLLSSVRKKLRPALKQKYAAPLEAIYEAGERQQENQIKALRDPNSKLSTTEKLRVLLASNLGLEEGDIANDLTYTAMGGDSLGAVGFSLSIEEIFETDIPTNDILSPASNIEAWAKHIDGDGAEQLPGYRDIHISHPELRVEDITLEKFITAEALAAAQSSDPISDSPPQTVFLTGANGFLGRFVCLDWLERLSKCGGTLICLVRASDDAAALKRLTSIFEDAAGEMQQRFEALSAHLEVFAGDFGEPHLGLAPEIFDKLAERVDRISHVGALVNHMMDYKQFFKPNVAGTAEIIRLALQKRLKPIDFVSSVAANRFMEAPTEANLDNFDIEIAPRNQVITPKDDYAAGYGISKWAGEALLAQAHTDFGVPVNVFRGDMILAHANFAGQINMDDMFTRLLYSVVKTGLAPHSFYKLSLGASGAGVPYDGIPVNVISEAVTDVGQHYNDDFTVFNIENFMAYKSQNLDTFIDWIIGAGYPVERLDHAEWRERFTQKLQSMPSEEKQRSVLAIIQAYEKPMPNWHFSLGHNNFKSLLGQMNVAKSDVQLNREFIEKCLADLVLKDTLSSPKLQSEPIDNKGNSMTNSVQAYGVTEEKSDVTPIEITRRTPGAKDVAIDIEYCGICHSDIHLAHNDWGSSRYPMVPGHEIIGRVSHVGSDVSSFKVDERVSVGCLVGSCKTCGSCDAGDEQYCENGMVWTYNSLDYHNENTLTMGGYSGSIVVDEDFVIGVPDNLDPAGAAPLLCAGVTTWSPLRHWDIKPGMKVGIIGLGGLGHMGVKFASAMGAHTVMITTSPEKAVDAERLGAHEILISKDRDAMKAAKGSFDFLLDTVPVKHPINPYTFLLKRDGTICLVGAIEPLDFHGGMIMGGRKKISGFMIGGIKETREMMEFCGKHNITADVEVIKPSEINTAWERVQKSDVKYRFVIDLKAENKE